MANELLITGRGKRGQPQFEATWLPTPDGLRLRIEDARCDEFWLELNVPEALLRQWLAEVEAEAAEQAPDALRPVPMW